MEIYLTFADSISEAYREKLQTFADSILAEGITENRPPSIHFPGMNEETMKGIECLQRAYFNRYTEFESEFDPR